VFTGAKTQLRSCKLVCNGEREVFEVALNNGQRIELTADHRVYTPAGWREVRELEAGMEVNVQSRELSSVSAIEPFYLGALKYLLPRYDGKVLEITRHKRRTLLISILDRLSVNYSVRGERLILSRNHPIVDEVERLDLAAAERDVLEGYAYAAARTAASYKGNRAIYGTERQCSELS